MPVCDVTVRWCITLNIVYVALQRQLALLYFAILTLMRMMMMVMIVLLIMTMLMTIKMMNYVNCCSADEVQVEKDDDDIDHD